MRTTLLLASVLVLASTFSFADEASQTDWSAGDFAAAHEVSWRSVPGQLALSSTPLTNPAKHVIADDLGDAYGLYVVDFDFDGDTDVLGTTNESAEVIIWFNQGGSPVTWERQVVDSAYPGGTSVHPIDMDHDGDLDIVGAAQTPGNNVTWWRNDGGPTIEWTRHDIGYVAVACNVFAADVDGDGDVDVLSTSWSGQYLAWWRNDGGDPFSWTREYIDTAMPGAHSAFAADVDADGDTDIVGTAATSDEVLLFVNDGAESPSWTRQVINSSMSGVRYATAADVDDDGLTDLVATGFDGQVLWWRNAGGSPPTWSEHTIDTLCPGGHYVIVSDLDGDGANDVLVVPWILNTLVWFTNDGGDPDAWTAHEIDSTFLQPLTAFPGDIDGDGDLDLVGTSGTLGEIAWWEITEYLSSGHLVSTVLDIEEGRPSTRIEWHAQVSEHTDLSLRVRSSDDPADLGEWTVGIEAPAVLMRGLDRYVQYRVDMLTHDPTVSPILHDLTISWGWPWEVEEPLAAPVDGD